MPQHEFVAGGVRRDVDGNILQKGHSYSQLVFVALMAAGNCLVIGEKNPSGLSNVPDIDWRTTGARFFTNAKVLVPINIWQTAHGLGAFGLE